MAKVESINIQPIVKKTIIVTIAGDSDLICNQMNDVTKRKLTGERENKALKKEEVNEWEEVITSIHWVNGTTKDFSEEGLKDALKNNKPCFTAFGYKKSLGDTVVRNEIDKYKTKFDASVNIVGEGDNLIPFTFTEYHLDKKLMSPKKGAPVLVKLNRFSGWKADIKVQFIEGGVYSTEQIVNIINMAGFGMGIGSGRTSGYGRYHVENVRQV